MPLSGPDPLGPRLRILPTMSSNKFTDTQLVLLSAAAQHPEGATELASDLKGGIAKKAVGKLMRDGLIEEIPAGAALPVWRRDDATGALGLRITPRGLAAIGVAAPVAEREAEKPHETQDEGKHCPKRPAQRVAAASRKKAKGEVRQEPPKPSRVSKQTRVLEMLQRQQGATIAAIMKATGWQQHSVRGFLAGVVRKRLKLKLGSEKVDGQRVYQIASAGIGKSGARQPKRRPS
jgi:hypothetical protein